MSQAIRPVRSPRENATLALAALGVVYGDIGTSPLYTLHECFSGSFPVTLTESNVLGILSLVFWALMVVVTLKYVLFIMRADNNGEGGILALTALIRRTRIAHGTFRNVLISAGIFGAALFFGDGIITPAISVLSAVEGLKVIGPSFEPYVIPVTIVVLIALFMMQKKGTGTVGALFGPIMMLWFLVIAVLGLSGIQQYPAVLKALNPWYGIHFLAIHGLPSFRVFGGVVLAVTGAEALYADMGHFGSKPIRYAWLGVVLPALTLNYFGQGALLLYSPGSLDNPFFYLAPAWFQWPLIALSTVATVIASQAVISGVFSMARQAIQLGYWPRTNILYTSTKEIGQIYVPQMNWFLLVAIIVLVLGFRTSGNLATAYGTAVTATMMVTTMLACVLARRQWKWSRIAVIAIGLGFLTTDTIFLGANMLKFFSGGWFPLLIGLSILVLMMTWRRGRKVLRSKLEEDMMPLEPFIQSLMLDKPITVPGTAIFMISAPDVVPHALLHNLKHNKVIHERVVMLTVYTEEIPFVAPENRIEIRRLDGGFYVIKGHYGFKESADVPQLLKQCGEHGLHFNMMDTSFFLNRERLIPSADPSMPIIFEHIFAMMTRNAMNATDFFNIPTNRVVELGTQVEI